MGLLNKISLLIKYIIISAAVVNFSQCTEAADNVIISVTSRDLINSARILDGRAVVMKGEVVGNIMRRDQFAWLSLEDDFNIISVWSPWAMTKGIAFTGNYLHRGDIVEVKGRFYRSDPDLKGEMCIRAEEIKILSHGFKTPHTVNSVKIRLALGLMCLTISLGFLRLMVKRRMTT